MATVTATGGSQIDVRSLATQLVAAERATQDQQISRSSARVTTQLSALGQLMGSMASFRSTLTSLTSIASFSMRSASSADSEVFTASASGAAVPGSYDIEVQQLARAQQISSTAFPGGAQGEVGTGTLTLSLGAVSFDVEVTSDNASLAGIRDAINSASGNPGIRATLVQGTDGARLVLSSSKTGAANTITVAQAGGDGGLAALTYGPGDTDNFTVIKPAQDAIVLIAGAETVSASNVIDGAIDGVTLSLQRETEPGDTVALTVDYDRTAVSRRIEAFVNAYNALETQIAKLRSYDAGTRVAGPMLGDSMLSGIEAELRRTLGTAVAGQPAGFDTLAAIGITTQRNGTLSVDTTKLNNALTSDFDAVGRLFGSEQGVGATLSTQLEARLKSGGVLDMRSKSLATQQKGIETRKQELDNRMELRLQSYIKQFTRLDTLLSSLQVTSSYLTQQIESLGNLNKAGSR